jgi:hypothetical protein
MSGGQKRKDGPVRSALFLSRFSSTPVIIPLSREIPGFCTATHGFRVAQKPGIWANFDPVPPMTQH